MPLSAQLGAFLISPCLCRQLCSPAQPPADLTAMSSKALLESPVEAQGHSRQGLVRMGTQSQHFRRQSPKVPPPRGPGCPCLLTPHLALTAAAHLHPRLPVATLQAQREPTMQSRQDTKCSLSWRLMEPGFMYPRPLSSSHCQQIPFTRAMGGGQSSRCS